MNSRRRAKNDLQQQLPKPRERTGRHKCTNCLKAISSEEFLRNDFLCDECAAKDEYQEKR
jgi:hypothetical protein